MWKKKENKRAKYEDWRHDIRYIEIEQWNEFIHARLIFHNWIAPAKIYIYFFFIFFLLFFRVCFCFHVQFDVDKTAWMSKMCMCAPILISKFRANIKWMNNEQDVLFITNYIIQFNNSFDFCVCMRKIKMKRINEFLVDRTFSFIKYNNFNFYSKRKIRCVHLVNVSSCEQRTKWRRKEKWIFFVSLAFFFTHSTTSQQMR